MAGFAFGFTVIFVCGDNFLSPVFYMLYKSVDNTIVPQYLPHTLPTLADWNVEDSPLPPNNAFAGMLADIKTGAKEKTITQVGRRLNFETPGLSSIFRKSARNIKKVDDDLLNVLVSHFAIVADTSGLGAFLADKKDRLDEETTTAARQALIEVDKKWGEPDIWRNIKYFSGDYTGGYFLRSGDAAYSSSQDAFKRQEEKERIYVRLFIRTLILSVIITLTTILMGYPVAFLLSNIPLRISNLLMILVLLPFWTSLLVRTSSWIVLLQEKGVVNEILVNLGLVDNANRLEIIHNSTGTIIAMTHILLPFMILPLYSVMKTISPSYMRRHAPWGRRPLPLFAVCIFCKPCPASAPGRFWSLFYPSAITSPRNLSAAPPALLSPTESPTTFKVHWTGAWARLWVLCCWSWF